MSLPLAALREALARLEHTGVVGFTPRQLFYEIGRAAGIRSADDDAAFAAALAVHTAEMGALPGLLQPAAPRPLPLAGREPDLTHYGLPRLLLCQDEEVAQMLRANLFHMETGCAVLALPAPGPVPAPYRAMLKRARQFSVCSLHDASVAGLTWAAELAAVARLPREGQLRTLGLRPAHALRLQLPARRGGPVNLDRAALGALSAHERAWLAEGWSAELAALPPARLLRTLRRLVLAPAPASSPPSNPSTVGFLTSP